jgi:hypothetical protein
MNEQQDHDDEVRQLLKDALPPVDTDLRRDLWPLMLRKMQAQTPPRVAWFDWALLGLVGGVIVVFPDLFLVLVYHL